MDRGVLRSRGSPIVRIGLPEVISRFSGSAILCGPHFFPGFVSGLITLPVSNCVVIHENSRLAVA